MRKLTQVGIWLMAMLIAATANAGWSGNIGWANNYYYRGIFQASSSASGGIDYEKNGFYAGTWAADVGDGLEVDAYLGFGGDVRGFTYALGFTGYYYTQAFDDTYEELNLSTAYGVATVDVAVGRYDNFGTSRQNYTYYSLTLEKDGFHGKFGGFSQDFAGEYLEFGYETTMAEFDVGLSLILANDKLTGVADESLVISVGRSFEF